MAVQDRPRGGDLGFEHRPFRNLAVPLHKRRNWTATLDDDLEEFPHRIGDRAVMTVDEQAVALVVALFSVPCQMNFADMLDREIGEIVERGIARFVADTNTLLTSSNRPHPVWRANSRRKSVSLMVDSRNTR